MKYRTQHKQANAMQKTANQLLYKESSV